MESNTFKSKGCRIPNQYIMGHIGLKKEGMAIIAYDSDNNRLGKVTKKKGTMLIIEEDGRG